MSHKLPQYCNATTTQSHAAQLLHVVNTVILYINTYINIYSFSLTLEKHIIHLWWTCFSGVLYSTSPFSFLILLLNSFPSIQRKSSPGWMMPHLIAIALAVLMLSPVTIRTVIPARWHFRMASGTCRHKIPHWEEVSPQTHTHNSVWYLLFL